MVKNLFKKGPKKGTNNGNASVSNEPEPSSSQPSWSSATPSLPDTTESTTTTSTTTAPEDKKVISKPKPIIGQKGERVTDDGNSGGGESSLSSNLPSNRAPNSSNSESKPWVDGSKDPQSGSKWPLKPGVAANLQRSKRYDDRRSKAAEDYDRSDASKIDSKTGIMPRSKYDYTTPEAQDLFTEVNEYVTNLVVARNEGALEPVETDRDELFFMRSMGAQAVARMRLNKQLAIEPEVDSVSVIAVTAGVALVVMDSGPRKLIAMDLNLESSFQKGADNVVDVEAYVTNQQDSQTMKDMSDLYESMVKDLVGLDYGEDQTQEKREAATTFTWWRQLAVDRSSQGFKQ